MARNPAVLVSLLSDWDGKDLAKAQREIAKMQAQTKTFSDKFAAMGKSIQNVGQSVSKAGGTLTKSVTLPIVGIGAAAVATAAEFEKSMNRVRAVSGATGDDFDALRDQAAELGRTTAFTAGQAAEGMSFLAMAGFKTTDILESMPGVLQLAAAGQMDLAEAADIASNVLTGYGKTADEMTNVVDILAKTFTSANTDLSQLGEAMTYAAPVAASAGVQFEEAAAAIGLMGNAGIQGSMAGTSLRNAIAALLDPTRKQYAAMKDLGLTVTDATGQLLPFEDIVRQLGESGATTSDFITIFGKRAGPAMAALVDQGADALADLTSELENAGGTAQSIADTQLQGLQGQLTKLKSAFEGLMISIADSGLLDRATVLMEQLTAGVGQLTAKFESLSPSTQNIILKMAAIAAAIGPVLLIVGKLISSVGAIIAVFNPLTLKIALVVAAVAALAAGFMYLWNNSETLRNTVMEAWNSIRAAVSQAIDQVKQSLYENRDAIETLRQAFMQIMQFLADYVIPALVLFYSVYLQTLITFLAKIITTVIELISYWTNFIAKLVEVGTAIIEFLATAKTNIDTFVEGVRTALVNTFNEIRDFFAEVFADIYTTITDTIKRAINYVIGGINRVINAWNGISFTIPTVTVPFVGTFGGQSVGTNDIQPIQELADGGIVSKATLAVIGEAGPEAVVPLRKSGNAGQFLGGSNITINVTAGMGTDGAEVGRQIVDAIRKYERRSGPVFAGA